MMVSQYNASQPVSAWVIFTDLKGFSKLSDEQLGIYYQKVLPELARTLRDYLPLTQDPPQSCGNANVLVWNTWGDALIAIVDDAKTAVELMLDYRDFFLHFNFDKYNMPALRARIAGHYGQFTIYPDPMMQGRNNAIGHHINTAARLEPITIPNYIYVTEEFVASFGVEARKQCKIDFDDAGDVPLAKEFGKHNVFRLRRTKEQGSIIYRILRQDLSVMLPDPGGTSELERLELQKLKHLTDAALTTWCTGYLANEKLCDTSSDSFLVKLSALLKNRGLYQCALDVIDVLENQKYTMVDGLKMNLNRCSPGTIKTKVNCLTRLGRYEPAANEIYTLYKSGHKTVDVLSMLAAQYKRRAIYGDTQAQNKQLTPLPAETIDQQLLHRALSLYIEAWRIDMEDIYPAINVMYLYSFSIGAERTRGNALAHFIHQYWSALPVNDWWTASSVLETNLLVDLEGLADKFKEAIEEFNPDTFSKDATRSQIEMYSQITGQHCEEIAKVIQVLG